MERTDQERALYCLKLAYEVAAEKSTDPSTQNGAVLVGLPCSEWTHEVNDQGQLEYVQRKPCREFIASANFFPQGVQESEERWTRPLKYKFVEHAERNVIYHLRSRKPLHRRCWYTKRPSEANETVHQPFRVGDEGDELKVEAK
jgi:deoxycytidylate deaminase